MGIGLWASVSGFPRDLKKATAGGKESCVISESQPNPGAGTAALKGGAQRVLGADPPGCSPLAARAQPGEPSRGRGAKKAEIVGEVSPPGCGMGRAAPKAVQKGAAASQPLGGGMFLPESCDSFHVGCSVLQSQASVSESP